MRRPSAAKGDELKAVAPDFVELTDRVLYSEVWERPGLAPRDRSMLTIAALMASGRLGQLENHIRFGLENGITMKEMEEIMIHLAFYAGWPSAVAATRTFHDVVKAREAAGS
ncbi:carboxymuconolactone decarboxylase family protein [Sphingobium nicotianae]|uniref:Carboxymuconolactone decarboxylase family protein n=1 Tax=Sphingobium nicotianae TaxID=2782607 RepID=A0A9X1IRL9_9SPHN|nr:carboxymuconolactone decarboxylase family protein [Sphingobium nicotianae]MBT2187320.1 carboxymuconolactone decarboxylase family protein [Sphingobium nicotianae]